MKRCHQVGMKCRLCLWTGCGPLVFTVLSVIHWRCTGLRCSLRTGSGGPVVTWRGIHSHRHTHHPGMHLPSHTHTHKLRPAAVHLPSHTQMPTPCILVSPCYLNFSLKNAREGKILYHLLHCDVFYIIPKFPKTLFRFFFNHFLFSLCDLVWVIYIGLSSSSVALSSLHTVFVKYIKWIFHFEYYNFQFQNFYFHVVSFLHVHSGNHLQIYSCYFKVLLAVPTTELSVGTGLSVTFSIDHRWVMVLDLCLS